MVKADRSALTRDVVPGWLRFACFLIGCVVPAGVIAVGLSLVLLNLPSAELLGGGWQQLASMAIVVGLAGTAILAIVMVGISACLYSDWDAACFAALLTGVLTVLGIVLLAANYVGSGWHFTSDLPVSVGVYYLLTASALHARLAWLLARNRAEPSQKRPD